MGIDERSLRTCIKDSNFKKNVRNLAIIFDGDGKKNKFKEIVKELDQLNQENEDIPSRRRRPDDHQRTPMAAGRD